jgi:hypothetical protein
MRMHLNLGRENKLVDFTRRCYGNGKLKIYLTHFDFYFIEQKTWANYLQFLYMQNHKSGRQLVRANAFDHSNKQSIGRLGSITYF